MIDDDYHGAWKREKYPFVTTTNPSFAPNTIYPSCTKVLPDEPIISREEFDALRRDVKEMTALLKRATPILTALEDDMVREHLSTRSR